MAYATDYAKENLATGQFHPAGPKNTRQAGRASLLGYKEEIPVRLRKDWMGKYAPTLRKTILPIPKLVAEIVPKTLFFIVTNLKTRRLAGLKKETFGELLRTAGFPGRY